MKLTVRSMCTFLALVLGAWLGAGGAGTAETNDDVWKPILDETAAKKLIAAYVKTIQEEAMPAKRDAKAIRKSYKKIRVAAVMIAAVAQSTKAGAARKELAAYRAAALELAETASTANWEKTSKLAEALSAPKPSPNPNVGPMPLKKYLDDAGDVMHPFRRFALGGDGLAPSLQSTGPLKSLNGIEEKLRVLGRRALKPAQLDKESADLVMMAQKTAVIAQMAHEWAPAKEGKKDPKDWREWSTEMRDSALKLGNAAAKKDPKGVLTATKSLNSSCTKCHGAFKENS